MQISCATLPEVEGVVWCPYSECYGVIGYAHVSLGDQLAIPVMRSMLHSISMTTVCLLRWQTLVFVISMPVRLLEADWIQSKA